MPRQTARRASDSKPYSKPTSVSSSPTLAQPPDNTSSLPSTDEVPSRPGFPTYSQYKRIEANYLACLSPRKRDKALITQIMFDKIWEVLHQPDACDIETPQFRFWVRKMFTLSKPQAQQSKGFGDDAGELPPVVLHENRPVAVMEQLYGLFCYCHERAGHGGRDKTCAVIRQHYSWVPKELTAQFVKACPTCTLKRSGNPEFVAMVQEQAQGNNLGKISGQNDQHPYVAGDGAQYMQHQNWPPTTGPSDLHPPESGHDYLFPNRAESATSHSSDSSTSPGLHTYPMSREISLFHGMPHQWPYLAPLAPPMTPNSSGYMVGHPMLDPSKWSRIPSVIFRDSFRQGIQQLQAEEDLEELDNAILTLPSLSQALSGGSRSNDIVLRPPNTTPVEASLPPSLQQLQLSSPITSGDSNAYVPQIDPALLESHFNGADRGEAQVQEGSNMGNGSQVDEVLNSVNCISMSKSTSIEISPTPAKLKRRMARGTSIPTLDLSSTSINGKNMMSFAEYRNCVLRNSVTPDEGLTPNSAGSAFSQLSAFPLGVSPGFDDMSPFTTAASSPMDETSKGADLISLSDTTKHLQLESGNGAN